jgi:hypothetical protein
MQAFDHPAADLWLNYDPPENLPTMMGAPAFRAVDFYLVGDIPNPSSTTKPRLIA